MAGGVMRGGAFLEHVLEALEPDGRELGLHPPHVARVLLGELHGCHGRRRPASLIREDDDRGGQLLDR